MSAIEQSLRRALLNGDAGDPQFRRRIYEAALRAHDRLVADRGLDAEAEAVQRGRLIAAIETIEAENVLPGVEETPGADSAEDSSDPLVEAQNDDGDALGKSADEEPPRAADTDDGRAPAPTAGPKEIVPDPDVPPVEPVRPDDLSPIEPIIVGHPSDAGRESDDGSIREGRSFDVAEASEDPPVAPSAAVPAGIVLDDRWRPGASHSVEPPKVAGKKSRRSRGRFFWVAIATTIAALLILAYVFSGLVATGDDSSAPAEGTTETAPAAGATQAAIDDGWIDVFSGDQLQSVMTPGGGRVVAVSGPGDAPAVRIEAPEGAEGVEIMIPIGPGLTGRLAGHTVRGEVTVGTPDENPRELGVRCVFGGEMACGRQRFSTALPSESFVFDMEVPADPGDAASLAIDPGLGSGGRNLDLYSVRMRILD